MPENDILRDEHNPNDSISDISDSDTEMVSVSSYSVTDSVRHSEMIYGNHINNENQDSSNITQSTSSFHLSAQCSLSNLSTFHRINEESTTTDTRRLCASDDWPSPYFPISPPNRNNNALNTESFNKFNKFDSQRFGNIYPSVYHGLSSMSAFSTPNRQTSCPKSTSPNLVNDPSAFMHSDVRIPFANYYNNLVRLLQTAATNGQLGKSRNSKEGNKNVFNFYWDRETPDAVNGDYCSKQNCVSNHGFTKLDNLDESMKTDEEILTESRRQYQSSTPPSFNTTGTSEENSPILSGHFQRAQVCHQSSPPSHGLVPLPQYAGVRGPSYPTQGQYSALPHPYLPMARYSYHSTNTLKTTPVKKYKCDVCGKAFSRSNTLVTHKRIHTGAKPFKCEICGRAFRQPGNLTRHRLTHTSVKPYVCPQCNKAFNRASNLNTHMRTHSNFRPYHSSLSGKGFGAKTDLKTSFMYSAKRVGSFRH